MHYVLVVKTADYSEAALQDLLAAYVPAVAGEKVGQYGEWVPWPYQSIEEYIEDEGLDEEAPIKEIINSSPYYRIGKDRIVYEKVSAHCDYLVFKGIQTYAEVLETYGAVGAFVKNGEFNYTTALDGTEDCPFALAEPVYVIYCHD